MLKLSLTQLRNIHEHHMELVCIPRSYQVFDYRKFMVRMDRWEGFLREEGRKMPMWYAAR